MKKDALSLSGGLFGILFVAGVMTAGAVGFPSAASAQSDVSRVIREEMGPNRSFLTDDERALIARKCGEAEERKQRGFNMRNGIMTCDNGREVDDPEVRALAKRVGERAGAHVRRVMNSPRVRDAINGDVQRRVAEATRRIHLQRPNIDRAMERARIHKHRVDHDEIRRNVERSLRHAHPHPHPHVQVAMNDDERRRLRADLEAVRRDLEQLREELRRERGESAGTRR